MAEATIHTGTVAISSAGNAVKVDGLLLTGQIEPGMFLRVPLNGTLDITLRIQEVNIDSDGSIRLMIDCHEDASQAEVVVAFNFADETLLVTETGEE